MSALVTKRTHPPDEGWIHAAITMKHDKPLSEAELQDVATWGRRTAHEFALTHQNGKRCRVVFRLKKEGGAA